MPRFYFHLYDDFVSIDEEGRDLPSRQAAHAEAVASAREMACAEVLEGQLQLDHRIEVAEATGNVIDTIWFRDVIQVSG